MPSLPLRVVLYLLLYYYYYYYKSNDPYNKSRTLVIFYTKSFIRNEKEKLNPELREKTHRKSTTPSTGRQSKHDNGKQRAAIYLSISYSQVRPLQVGAKCGARANLQYRRLYKQLVFDKRARWPWAFCRHKRKCLLCSG